ncbi:MAG: hypothetical protein V4633_07945 [Pseudomonadota bacterium]
MSDSTNDAAAPDAEIALFETIAAAANEAANVEAAMHHVLLVAAGAGGQSLASTCSLA